MGQFQVQQRTKDGMFNATALMKQWNESSGDKKEVTKFFENENTKAFISALMEEEKLNTQNSAYLKSRGKNGGTWMHPILFVKFAMWLNPRFEVKVIKFVYDEMIKYRNEAGDAYKELSAAIYTIVDKSQMPSRMAEVSKGINFVVFGEHRNMIRNDKGTEQDQRKLYEMERKVASLINDGFLKDHGQVMNYLRKKFQERTTPAVFVR
jgi:hypothetical protein